MRTLAHHIVDGDAANHQLRVAVEDAPGSGGACHRYNISGFDAASNVSCQQAPSPSDLTVLFQNGPIKEVGIKGVTHETLLAILIDRMEGFQSGPYATAANASALGHLRGALYDLQSRTRERMARGVEGTHAA